MGTWPTARDRKLVAPRLPPHQVLLGLYKQGKNLMQVQRYRLPVSRLWGCGAGHRAWLPTASQQHRAHGALPVPLQAEGSHRCLLLPQVTSPHLHGGSAIAWGLPSQSSSISPPLTALERDDHRWGHIGEQQTPPLSIPLPHRNTCKLLTQSSS